MIGYKIYLIPWKYLSNSVFFENIFLLTKIGYVVHFYRYLLSKNMVFNCFNCFLLFLLVFTLLYFSLHIVIRLSFCILNHLDNHEGNPWNILITTFVRNIDWHSFNFDQLFFVFLTVRTICTSKLKHFIVSVMGIEREKVEN